MMKKSYINPETKSYRFTVDNVLQHFAAGSDIAQPKAGPISAPARRITVLGSLGGGAGVGSLGSIGTVK